MTAMRILLLLLLVSFPLEAQTRWSDPSAEWTTIGPPKGTLVICGGFPGGERADLFLSLLKDRNAPIVVIPTADGKKTHDMNHQAVRVLREKGARNITILHTYERRTADSPAFVEPLRRAEGVWISGGYQSYLSKSYYHTRTHTELFRLLERGGVIAGNSAGASIMGSYLYGGHAAGTMGLGFVRKTAIGQHFLRRRRRAGLVKIVKGRPDLLGIGLDEDAFILVRGNTFQVFGPTKVALAEPLRPGWPGREPYRYLLPGDKYDLAKRSIHRAHPWKPDTLWPGRFSPFPYPSWKTQGPPKGKILLAGVHPGKEVFQAFLEALKDPKAPVLVVPTASVSQRKEKKNRALAILRSLGARRAALWHTLDRRQADSPAFTKPIRDAGALWFSAGDAWRLAEVYRHTLFHLELFHLLERGGVIGGAGGGAKFLASWMAGEAFGWDRGAALLPRAALYPWRGKKRDVQGMVKALLKNRTYLGIGLDPGAAVLVSADQALVLGKGKAAFFDPTFQGWPWPGQDDPFLLLDPGDAFDLKTRRPDW